MGLACRYCGMVSNVGVRDRFWQCGSCGFINERVV